MLTPNRLCLLVVQLLIYWVVPLRAKDTKPVFVYNPQFVGASGKWESVSGRAGDQLVYKHDVEIQCCFDIKECYVATAQIVSDTPRVILENYSVIQWDKNGIIAEDNSPICVVNRLQISFQERSVVAVDAPKKGAHGMLLENGKDACQLVNHTQTYRLVNFWK